MLTYTGSKVSSTNQIYVWTGGVDQYNFCVLWHGAVQEYNQLEFTLPTPVDFKCKLVPNLPLI